MSVVTVLTLFSGFWVSELTVTIGSAPTLVFSTVFWFSCNGSGVLGCGADANGSTWVTVVPVGAIVFTGVTSWTGVAEVAGSGDTSWTWATGVVIRVSLFKF